MLRNRSPLWSTWQPRFNLLRWYRHRYSTCSLHSASILWRNSNCWAGGGRNPSESRPLTFSLRGVYGSRLDFRHLSYVTPVIPHSHVKTVPSFLGRSPYTSLSPGLKSYIAGNMAEKCPPFIPVSIFKCKELTQCTSGLMAINVASDDFPGSMCM